MTARSVDNLGMPTLVSQDRPRISLTARTVIGRDASQCQIVLNEPFISRAAGCDRGE